MGNNRDDYWFRHAYGQRSREELAALIDAYGAEGYWVYDIIKEMLHQAEDARIEYTDKRMKRLAGYMKISFDRLKLILDDCFHVFDIFLLEEGFIVCPEVVTNKEEREQFRNKKVDSGRKGGLASAKKNKASGEDNAALGDNNAASANKNSLNGQQNAANDNNNVALAGSATANRSNVVASANENTTQNEQNAAQYIHNSTVQNTSPPSEEEGEDIDISADLLKKYEKEHWIGWKNRKKIILGKAKFTEMVAPFVKKYGQEVCNRFWKYWTEPSTNRSGKLRWEGEKYFDLDARLGTFKNDRKN